MQNSGINNYTQKDQNVVTFSYELWLCFFRCTSSTRSTIQWRTWKRWRHWLWTESVRLTHWLCPEIVFDRLYRRGQSFSDGDSSTAFSGDNWLRLEAALLPFRRRKEVPLRRCRVRRLRRFCNESLFRRRRFSGLASVDVSSFWFLWVRRWCRCRRRWKRRPKSCRRHRHCRRSRQQIRSRLLSSPPETNNKIQIAIVLRCGFLS